MTSSAAQFTPPESPISPTASFYDLSDNEEGEYNTIMHSQSGRGVKLLFSKSKVCAASPGSRQGLQCQIRSTCILRHRPRRTFRDSSPSFSKKHRPWSSENVRHHPLLRKATRPLHTSSPGCLTRRWGTRMMHTSKSTCQTLLPHPAKPTLSPSRPPPPT